MFVMAVLPFAAVASLGFDLLFLPVIDLTCQHRLVRGNAGTESFHKKTMKCVYAALFRENLGGTTQTELSTATIQENRELANRAAELEEKYYRWKQSSQSWVKLASTSVLTVCSALKECDGALFGAVR